MPADTKSAPDEQALLQAGIAAVRETLARVLIRLAEKQDDALDKLWYPKLNKHLLKMDVFAEYRGKARLEARLGEAIQIRGEESSLEPVSRDKPAALLDMLDGSDLLERGFGNWCSAIVFFDPAAERILAAVIGLPSRRVYCATSSGDGAYVILSHREPDGSVMVRPVRPKFRQVTLRDAAVAFYGQQAGNLTAALCPTFRNKIKEIAAQKESAEQRKVADQKDLRGEPAPPAFRIYNLAGNPMMLKLAESKLDAVFDVAGQYCHDVVPGAFIALKAGAVLKDLNGQRITEEELGIRISSNPGAKLKYVLACTESLCDELLQLLSERAQDSGHAVQFINTVAPP